VITNCAGDPTICPHPCTLQPSSSPYTPYACGAQRALRHEYSLSTGSGLLWLWLWCSPYKVCSDLNSQPKRLGDLDLWPRKWCLSYVWHEASVLEVGPMYVTDVRQTDVRQKHFLMPLPIRGGHNNNNHKDMKGSAATDFREVLVLILASSTDPFWTETWVVHEITDWLILPITISSGIYTA